MADAAFRSSLTDQVVHETIDEETVIIDLATGAYFSLDGRAARAWEGLAAGADAQAIADRLARAENVPAEAVLPAVLALFRELHAAGLLTDCPPAPPPTLAGAFAMPPVHRYDDMREHLLVDPIHEVERGEGWPGLPTA